MFTLLSASEARIICDLAAGNNHRLSIQDASAVLAAPSVFAITEEGQHWRVLQSDNFSVYLLIADFSHGVPRYVVSKFGEFDDKFAAVRFLLEQVGHDFVEAEPQADARGPSVFAEALPLFPVLEHIMRHGDGGSNVNLD